MESFEHRLPATATQDEVEALLTKLNADVAVDGILLQLPLPGHLDEQAAVAAIVPDKDVDGLTPVSAGRPALGIAGMVPCTPYDRQSVVAGKRVSVRVDVGGRRSIKKKNNRNEKR